MTDPTTEPEAAAESPPSSTKAPASALVDRLTKILVYDYPFIPGRRYEDWPIDDPAETDAYGVEAIRDDIDARVRELLDSIFPGLALPELTHPKS